VTLKRKNLMVERLCDFIGLHMMAKPANSRLKISSEM
jgi:hypothetical protein